jgi:DNA-cytosine methyltransferase
LKILSLFNGISALHLACDRVGLTVDTCYYAEIDKYANKVTEKHYPNDIALGDVTKWREWDIDWSEIGLVGAGFPCQAWSVAGKQLGDKDERGMLFWTTLEIIAHVLKHNPSAKFLMENVKMKKDFEQYITHHTEQALSKVEKTLINSALVSAQNRQRYYWTNFEVSQPNDKGILLKDIIEDNVGGFISLDESNYTERCKKQIKKNSKTKDQKAVALCTNSNLTGSGVNVLAVHGGAIRGRYTVDGKRQDHKMKTAGLTEQRLEVRNDGKTNTLTTVQKDNVVVYSVNDNNRVSGITENERGFRPHKADSAKSGISELGRILKTNSKTDTLTTSHSPKVALNGDVNDLKYRKLTPVECERLQTFPDNWTDCISNTQRYKSLGNAWTVDVIAHILKHI